MAHVVFFRAANVGGRNVFRPARMAARLAHLDILNVGAAGTFVVRGKATPASIRREILGELSFVPEIVIRPAGEILALVSSDPFRGVAFSKVQRGWVAALRGRPKTQPALPLARPEGKAWSVRFDRLEGGFALGLWRWRPGGFLFPSNCVEDALGVAATTRWWETFQRVARLLEG
jgi:hypothetical protein